MMQNIGVGFSSSTHAHGYVLAHSVAVTVATSLKYPFSRLPYRVAWFFGDNPATAQST